MSKTMLMIVATTLVGCAPGEVYQGDPMNLPDPWRKVRLCIESCLWATQGGSIFARSSLIDQGVSSLAPDIPQVLSSRSHAKGRKRLKEYARGVLTHL